MLKKYMKYVINVLKNKVKTNIRTTFMKNICKKDNKIKLIKKWIGIFKNNLRKIKMNDTLA